MNTKLLVLWGCLASLGPLTPAIVSAAPDVLVVSDVFPEFSSLPRATPEHPIYYFLKGSVQRDSGPQYAGEKMPEKTRIENAVVEALKSQGYVRTEIGGPRPSLMLIYAYGAANASMDDFISEEEDSDGNTETTTNTVFYNAHEMSALVGANKLKDDQGYGPDYDGDTVREALHSDRLYITIGALDIDSLIKKKKKVVWRTRISIDSTRNSLPDAMQLMLTSAAPYFGRATDKPLSIGDAERRNATVKVGEATVVDEKSDSAEKKK